MKILGVRVNGNKLNTFDFGHYHVIDSIGAGATHSDNFYPRKGLNFGRYFRHTIILTDYGRNCLIKETSPLRVFLTTRKPRDSSGSPSNSPNIESPITPDHSGSLPLSARSRSFRPSLPRFPLSCRLFSVKIFRAILAGKLNCLRAISSIPLMFAPPPVKITPAGKRPLRPIFLR